MPYVSRSPHSRGWWVRLKNGYGPGFSVLAPEDPMLFSERDGHRWPILRFRGWRVFRLRAVEG